jgi:hypothetical protein
MKFTSTNRDHPTAENKMKRKDLHEPMSRPSMTAKLSISNGKKMTD